MARSLVCVTGFRIDNSYTIVEYTVIVVPQGITFTTSTPLNLDQSLVLITTALKNIVIQEVRDSWGGPTLLATDISILGMG